MSSPRRLPLAVGALAILLAGCRQDMFDQPRVKPLGRSDFYPDALSARQPVPGTVARGQLRENAALATGLGPDGAFVSELPLALTPQLLARGRERFDIFCSPCHGRTGNGRGMIVRRGFKPPASYHTDRLRAQPVGYFFHVMTSGMGQMASYAPQVPVNDRWAIAAYVRALQVAHATPAAGLAPADVRALEAGAAPPAPAAAAYEEHAK